MKAYRRFSTFMGHLVMTLTVLMPLVYSAHRTEPDWPFLMLFVLVVCIRLEMVVRLNILESEMIDNSLSAQRSIKTLFETRNR